MARQAGENSMDSTKVQVFHIAQRRVRRVLLCGDGAVSGKSRLVMVYRRARSTQRKNLAYEVVFCGIKTLRSWRPSVKNNLDSDCRCWIPVFSWHLSDDTTFSSHNAQPETVFKEQRRLRCFQKTESIAAVSDSGNTHFGSASISPRKNFTCPDF